MKSSFISEFKERGYFNQCTNSEELDDLMNNKKIGAYIGFDCTAPSLHVGSLLQIMCLRMLQKYGHRPIVLLGGGTTMIGDPSGKEETRKRLLNVYSTHFLRSLGSVHSSVDDDTLRDRKFNDISVDNGSIENIEGKQEQLEPPNKKVAISSTDRVSNPTKLKEKEGLISLCLVSPYSTPSLTPSSTPQKANVDQETDTSKFGAFSPNSAGVTAFL